MMRIRCCEYQRYDQFHAMKFEKKSIYEMLREELLCHIVFEKKTI